jgi:hypothetical protein
MCVKYSDECYCQCHNDPSIKHCMPCCRTCTKCGRHILEVFYEDHLRDCKEIVSPFEKIIKRRMD